MIDRKYFGVMRLSAIVFAVIVAGVLLVDYLLFAVKENGITAVVHSDRVVVTKLTDSVVEVKVPLVVKNFLSLDVSSGDLKVSLGGKSVPVGTGGFTVGAGSEDTVFIPLSLKTVKGDSALGVVDLRVSFTAGVFYRSWSGSYSGSLELTSLLSGVVKETADSFFNSEKYIKGTYKVEGTTLTAKLHVTNPFPYPVTLSFEKKPGLKSGGSNSVLSLSDVPPLVVDPNGKGEIVTAFNIAALKPAKNGDAKHAYALFGNIITNVAGAEEQRSKSVLLK